MLNQSTESLYNLVSKLNSMCTIPVMDYKDNEFDPNKRNSNYPSIISKIPTPLVEYLLDSYKDQFTPSENLYFTKISKDITEGKFLKLETRFSTKYLQFINDNSKVFYKFSQFLNKNVLKGSSYFDPFTLSLVTIFNQEMMKTLFLFMDSENWLRDNYLPYEFNNDFYIKSIENMSKEALLRYSEDLFFKNEAAEIAHIPMFRYNCW